MRLRASRLALAACAAVMACPVAGRPLCAQAGRTLPVAGTIVLATNGADVSVVRVPVPAMVLAARSASQPWRYAVRTDAHTQLLGASRGLVASDSAVLVPLRVSRRAPAGRLRAATVIFSSALDSVAMTVELDVPTMRALTVVPAARSIVAARGAWTPIAMRFVNDGNVAEPVTLRAAPPPGWRSVWRAPSDAQIAPGARAEGELRIWIPPEASLGISLVAVEVALPDGRTQSELLQVEVLGRLGAQAEGPVVRASVANAFGVDQRASTGYALEVTGQLTDSTRVAGRFTYAGRNPELSGASFALARSGVITAPPMLELSHPSRELKLGAVGGTLPELGGQFLTGLGVAGRLRHGRWDGRAHSLAPPALTQQFALFARNPGHLAGAEVGYTTGAARTALFGSSLRDPFTRRELSAVGLRTAIGRSVANTEGMVSGRGSALIGELAMRSHGNGPSLGVTGSYRYSGAATAFDFRALHAPGGTQSFARASNEYTVSASRTLGRRHGISGGGWWQNDANAVIGAAESQGWFVTPTASLGRLGTVTIEARGTRFSAGSGSGTLIGVGPGGALVPSFDATAIAPAGLSRVVNDEVSGAGSYFFDVLGTQVMARSTLTSADRRLLEPGLPENSSRQLRLEHMLLVSRSIARGTLQAMWQQQQASGLGGLMPPQQSIQLRLDRLRPVATKPVDFGVEYQRLAVGSGAAPFWMARATLTVPLLAGTSLTLGAERNPFVGGFAGGARSAVLYSMRVDRSTRFRRPFQSGGGQVFRDDNGNGVRDAREHGVANVVIRCGSQRVLSDRSGRFQCDQLRREVDPRSVPPGLVAPRVALGAGESVPLRVLQPMRITLRMTNADVSRLPQDALAGARVVAQDSLGGQWLARSTGGGSFVLDALPVGSYTIAVDGSDLAEPVVPVSSPPRVLIGGDQIAPRVDVVLRARPLRIRTFQGTDPLPTAPNATAAPVPVSPAAVPTAAAASPTPSLPRADAVVPSAAASVGRTPLPQSPRRATASPQTP
jgi:hypothetical protein